MLEHKLGGARTSGRLRRQHGLAPSRRLFFREPGEGRAHTSDGLRIVRVGTHALKAGSGTKLWTRLSQHKGIARSVGGNHRGAIFRLIVGAALIEKENLDHQTWGILRDDRGRRIGTVETRW